MIINVHTHLNYEPDKGIQTISQLPVKQAVTEWKKRGINHVCICPGGKLSLSPRSARDNHNDAVEKLCEDWKGFFIPFGRVRPEADKPSYVDQLAKRGFKGLKFIDPAVPYDDESNFPFYEKAEKHGLVCLFHTGWLGHAPDIKRDHVVRVHNMQPIHLDAIGRVFGGLNIVGAHLGNLAYCMQAVEVAKWMANVYFDITGGVIRRQPVELLKMLFCKQKVESLVDPRPVLNEQVMEKMIFGSDNAPPDVFMKFHANLFKMFKVPQALRAKVMGGTLAKMLSL